MTFSIGQVLGYKNNRFYNLLFDWFLRFHKVGPTKIVLQVLSFPMFVINTMTVNQTGASTVKVYVFSILNRWKIQIITHKNIDGNECKQAYFPLSVKDN